MNINQLVANTAEAEKFMKLLANRHRLMILCNLLNQEHSVSELNKLVPLGQSALSQHLAALRNNELVATRRDAQNVYYCVSDPRIRQIIQTLYDVFCLQVKE